ncbi:MAG TPA: hypothetical protein VGK52_14145, partial [Polyangia bacterium]
SLAAHGPDAGGGVDDLIRRARTQPVASTLVRADGHDFVAAAARVPGIDDREAILILGRRVAVEAPAAPPPVVAAS